ncbi:glutathione S-transferase family protein [Tropicimonas sp.]|uniref:glutathione S-transferase family protein n=1 Tax=Tropicimonas sp. TaxID=2067044 RepID=UPI003A857DD5
MPTDYTLYYWPIPFRGHFVRYLLVHCRQTWDEPPVAEMLALKDQPAARQPVPFMAPPLLHHHAGDLWLSQLPAILGYLGRQHGLFPGAPAADALVHKIIGDASDVLEEITCNCGRAMWTQEGWNEFAAGRLPRWMAIFEETGRRHGLSETAGHMLGSHAPSLADLATAALWFTMTDKLPPLGPLLERSAPAVAALSRRIASLPEIAAMRKSCDARWGDAYCGGQIEESLRKVVTVWAGE